MELVFNNDGVGKYVLKILNAYYKEGMFTWGVQTVQICDVVAVHAMQSVVFFGVSLFFLLSKAKSKHFRIKRRRKKVEKVEVWQIIKKAKITEESREEKQKINMDIHERFEKIFLILLLACLTGIEICNKLVLHATLEYVSYPLVSIVRSFRLFPTPLLDIGQELNPQSTFSIITATMGIFIYIFSNEEKIESTEFLKRVSESHNFDLLHPDDKIKIVRLGLRFLYSFCSDGDLNQTNSPGTASIFMQSILDGKMPDQDYTLPVKEQAIKYYKDLLLLHRNKPISPSQPETAEVFKRLLANRNTDTPEIEKLAFSFIKMIVSGNNSKYFKAFLAQRKISAGIFLILYSCLEILLETGQVFLSNKFRIQPEFVLTAMNLLSATSLLGVLLYNPLAINNTLKNYTRDMVGYTITFSYIKLFSKRDSKNKPYNRRIALHMMVKFFYLFLSIIFYRHDFNAGHILGIVLLIPGCLMNLNIQNIILSRWSLSGYLQKSYM